METYNGCVWSPHDALVLFEACRIGLLPRVQRRLSLEEVQNIKPGSIFVWEEGETTIKKWTDWKYWSVSRVVGSFFVCMEMESLRESMNIPGEYRSKPDGLMKQSFSYQTLHLISYYASSDPSSPNLMQPTQDPALKQAKRETYSLQMELLLSHTRQEYSQSAVPKQQNVPMVTDFPHPSPTNLLIQRQGAPNNYAQDVKSYGSTPPTNIPLHFPSTSPTLDLRQREINPSDSTLRVAQLSFSNSVQLSAPSSSSMSHSTPSLSNDFHAPVQPQRWDYCGYGPQVLRSHVHRSVEDARVISELDKGLFIF
ncbi:Gluconate transport-inducing protein [Maublancomyces gigas]|uniref:Gluconate transport-inducing protein n=1 Tax=Discina gigas TaxID=1032678 RepID=A0ABR3G911_9PEZI